jgi:hypothetical protein
MSQNKIPTNLTSVEKLVQRLVAAERSNQKEIRMSIQEARDIVTDLSIMTSKLGKNIEEIQLNTSQVKLGVAYEVIPKLHLQMGLLLVQAKGNEFMPTRNAFNQVVFYERSNYDSYNSCFFYY